MSLSRTRKNQPFRELKLSGKYNDFTDFYDENKEIIYKSILEVFREFKVTKKKSLSLYVSAKIKGLEWDTEFNFHKEEAIVLKRDLMPFFESVEDYETCMEIKTLYGELTN
jgi:hypothetical protein